MCNAGKTASLMHTQSCVVVCCIQAAVADRVMVMVDAEYTYLNPALNLATLAMMLRCNAGNRRPLVFYTYQNYLKVSNLLQLFIKLQIHNLILQSHI